MARNVAPLPTYGPFNAAANTGAAFLVAGLLDAAVRAAFAKGPDGTKLLAVVLGCEHFCVIGVVAALIAAAGAALTSSTAGRSRLLVRAASLLALSLLLGIWTLRPDFAGFAGRQTALPSWLVLAVGVLGASASVPVAWVLGSWVGGRFARGARGLGLFVLCAGIAGNGLVLPNDYRGIHLYVALAVIVFAASSWANGRPFRAVVFRTVGLATLTLATLGVLLPARRAFPALARSTSAAFSPWILRIDARWGATQSNASDVDAAERPWFESRAATPPIAASEPRMFELAPLVLLVTVDALRADVVHGKYDADLPTFRALRERAVWFSKARSPGALTKVSLSCFFLGTHFSQQYWTNDAGTPTISLDATPRLPELLVRAGVSTTNVRSVGWLHNGNLVRGFQRERLAKDAHHYAAASTVTPLLNAELARLANRSPAEPAFVWSHWADPHAPYDLGKKRGSTFEAYLSEVVLVDHALSKVLAQLEETGLGERTLLIVSADHGEAFGEHHSQTHGTTVYDEGLRVPLFFVPPRASRITPRRIDSMVSGIDLGPTLLDLFGAPTPGYMMGQSLVPFLRGQDPQLQRPIVAEAREFQTLVTPDELKIIYDVKTRQAELYDLSRDPEELHDLAGDPERLAEPLSRLQRFFEAQTFRHPDYERPIIR